MPLDTDSSHASAALKCKRLAQGNRVIKQLHKTLQNSSAAAKLYCWYVVAESTPHG